MDNFEARYRAIVEKNQELHHPEIFNAPSGNWMCGKTDLIPERIAREAVTIWLGKKLPDDYRICVNESGTDLQKWINESESWWTIKQFTDPADAILTAWEIVLGIKEKA
jgi:hypothetical protein